MRQGNRFLIAPALRVVFADANVLYVRILRDYLLYAAEKELISVTWSAEVLNEAMRNLMANNPSFTKDSAKRLLDALAYTFPRAEFNPTPDDYSRLAGCKLPDENDRHVLAAALAAEASIICTSNIKDFPSSITNAFGIAAMTPDDLLSELIISHRAGMLAVHAEVVLGLAGATDASTIDALLTAGVSQAVSLLSEALGISGIAGT